MLETEDINGNIGTEHVTVTVDNQAPVAPVGLVADVSGTEVRLSWQANREPDLLGYVVYRQGQPIRSAIVHGDLRSIAIAIATITYVDQHVVDGTHDYAVAAIDQAGNLSDISLPVTVRVDVRAPHAKLVEPRHGATFDAPIYLLATVEDHDVQHVQFAYQSSASSVRIPISPADATAPYETYFDPDALGLDYGTYELLALATDTSNHTDPTPMSIRVAYIDLKRPEPVEDVAMRVDGDAVEIQWTANRESDLAGYHIERRIGEEAFSRLTSAPLTQPAFVDHDLAEGIYDYAVIAVDTYGNEAVPTRVGPAVVYTPYLEPPLTPTTALTVGFIGRGPVVATVTGEMQTDLGRRELQPVDTTADGQFAFTDIPLERGVNHIAVRMTEPNGNRSKQATVTVVSAATPSPPTGLILEVDDLAVDLSWRANPEPNIAGYRVWRNGSPIQIAQPLTDLAAEASDHIYAGVAADRVLDGQSETYWSPKTIVGAWLALSWSQPRLVNEIEVEWYSVDYRTDDFDVEIWSEAQWVQVAAIRESADRRHRIVLSQAYLTTQIRLVVRRVAGPFRPRVATLGARTIPLITNTVYRESGNHGHYDYAVTAINTYGFESPLSAPASEDVGDVAPPEPVRLNATVIDADVHLSWTASAASDVQRYDIERDGVWLDSSTDLERRQYVDTARKNGTYVYIVRPVDQVGNTGEASNLVQVEVNAEPPVAPHQLVVTPVEAGGALDLHWQMDADAQPEGFQVWRRTASGEPYTMVADTIDKVWTNTGLHDGTTYSYVVTAVDAVGNASKPSNEASGTPQDRIAPQAPILHYPTLAGYAFETAEPWTTIIGSAEPGVRVRLMANGRHVADTYAQETLTQLDVALETASHTALSPDGRYIAFLVPDEMAPSAASEEEVEEEEVPVETSANRSLLRLYDTERHTTIDIAPVEQTDPLFWEPRGHRLIFNDRDDHTDAGVIRQYSITDDHITTLTQPTETHVEAMALSPDGQQIIVLGAVRGHDGLWLRPLESETYISLLSDTDGIDRNSLQWSPDSQDVAYQRVDTYEIRNVSTGQIRSIEGAVVPGSLRWSPHGQWLVYVVDNPAQQIRVYEFETDTTRDLALGLAPQWSADGRAIWYIDADRTSIVRQDLASGSEIHFLQGLELTPHTLEVVPSGWIGVLSQVEAGSATYHQLAPTGRFVVHPVRLAPGDNIVTATALDAAGNASLAAENLVITHRVGEQADLAIATADLVILPAAPHVGEVARVSMTIENRGNRDTEATTCSLVAIDPQGTIQTLFDDCRLPPLAPGARTTHTVAWTVGTYTGTYTLVAVVDPHNTLVERSEANNVALRELLIPEAAGLAVAVGTNAAWYDADQDVDITVQLSNNGELWEGQLDIVIEDANDIPVVQLRQEAISALAYGERLTFGVNWHTGATFAGAYQAIARLVASDGTVTTHATAPFRIVEQTQLAATVSADRLVYQADEAVRVTGQIDYHTGNQLLAELEATLRIVNEQDEVVAERDAVWRHVLPGATTTAILDWYTGRHPVGTYRITLEVRQGDAVLSQANHTLTIASGNIKMMGHLAMSSTTPGPDTQPTVTYTVINRSDVSFQQLPIMIRILEPGAWKTLHEQRVMADIGSSREHTATLSFATDTWPLQRYVVLLQVELPGVDPAQHVTLATQNFALTDHTAPAVTVETLTDGSITTGQAPVLITARDDHSTISSVEIRIDAEPWVPATRQNPGDHRYRATLSYLTEGPHTLTARAIDAAGHESTSPSVGFTIDRTPPQIRVVGVEDGQAYPGAVRPTIAVHDAHLTTTSITLDGQPFIEGADVTTEGEHELAISAADAAGNRTEATIRFVIDPTGPAITITGVTANGSYNRPVTPIITVTDAHKTSTLITLNGAPFQTGKVIDAEGHYELVVQATDVAGHTARQTLQFLVDRTAPALILEGVETGRMYNRDITPSIHVRDANPVVTHHTLNGQPLTSGTRLTAEGEYTLSALATDIAGNISRQSLSFTIDKRAPVIDIRGIQVDTVYRGEPYTYQVEAVDTANDRLRYTLLAAPLGMAIDDAMGLITWMPHEPGAYTVTVQVTDAQNAAATQTYVLIVADPQAVPAIISTPRAEATSGQVYQYQVEAIDPNGELLTYRLKAAPDGMVIDATTGLIVWTPEAHGRSEVVIQVENASGARTTQRYTLQIASQLGEGHR